MYYYPMQEQREQQNNFFMAMRRRFREERLTLRYYGEADGCELDGTRSGDNARSKENMRYSELDVVGCAVSPFYYKTRPWKPQVLAEAMENVLRHVEGMADTWIHPQIGVLLTEDYAGRFLPRRETVQMVAAQLVRQYAAGMIRECGEVAVLLGAPEDTDGQMQMTRELLQPYLPKINRLLIFYEEVAETDIWMELGSHLDEYYYEYGLVPQLEPYVASYGGKTDDLYEGAVLKCGKPRCGGMILDYSGRFRYPKILPGSKAVYIDMMSETEKERLLRRKTPWISYISPLKYLDTIVKSGYDR